MPEQPEAPLINTAQPRPNYGRVLTETAQPRAAASPPRFIPELISGVARTPATPPQQSAPAASTPRNGNDS